MPSSSSKHHYSSGHSSSPKHRSKQSHRDRKASTSTNSSGGSPKASVVIVLPPKVQPPVIPSSPSHRTAVPLAPALSKSTPSTSYLSAYIPTVRSTPQVISTSGSISCHHSSGPLTSATLTYNVAPISRSASNNAPMSGSYSARATITHPEDEYYNHPAVREYEMRKAAEQARWNRRMQMEREKNAQIGGGAAQAQPIPIPRSNHGQAYQQRW